MADMTVRRLIERLSEFDQDSEVNIIPHFNYTPLYVLDDDYFVYTDDYLDKEWDKKPGTVYIEGK